MATKLYKTDLRKLDFQPEENPLLESNRIALKKRYVTTGLKKDLVDLETGELSGASVIRTLEEKDDEQFVKVFSAGIAAAYELTKTAQRVFQAILQEYEQTPMVRGYVDSIYLVWFDGGLSGRKIGMSEYTFNRGLRELLDKEFLAPKTPNIFWVNPALFFKGDRVMFVKEYKRKQRVERDPNTIDFLTGKTDKEINEG